MDWCSSHSKHGTRQHRWSDAEMDRWPSTFNGSLSTFCPLILCAWHTAAVRCFFCCCQKICWIGGPHGAYSHHIRDIELPFKPNLKATRRKIWKKPKAKIELRKAKLIERKRVDSECVFISVVPPVSLPDQYRWRNKEDNIFFATLALNITCPESHTGSNFMIA